MRVTATGAKRHPTERGAAAVEVALTMPLLILVVIGALHFGDALARRYRLSDAVSFATRAGAIRGSRNLVYYRHIVEDRLGPSVCSPLQVTLATPNLDGVEVASLSATCFLRDPANDGLLAGIGVTQVSAQSAMPF